MSRVGEPALEIRPAPSWGDAVAATLAARLAERPATRLCLPTGETPTPFYTALAAAERRGAISFADATLVMLDEWLGYEPGDPASGQSMLRVQLIDRLGTPPARFVAIPSDTADPEAAAARHDLDAVLDIAIVGLGINGHVGFNEPGSGPDAPTRVVTLAPSSRRTAVERYGATHLATSGITIGLRRILEAGEVWLLVTGGRKAPLLPRVLRGPEGEDFPASFLRRHPRLTVFADEAAAAGLRDAEGARPEGDAAAPDGEAGPTGEARLDGGEAQQTAAGAEPAHPSSRIE